VPACAVIGGLPCRPVVHTIPNITRQHHAKYTPNSAYSTQHITLTEKTVPIQKQTALGTRCNQERRAARVHLSCACAEVQDVLDVPDGGLCNEVADIVSMKEIICHR
jgi:hypothetical protein